MGEVQIYRDLIQGFPDELLTECLIRVPYQFHSSVKSVCRTWRSLLSDPSFYRDRRKSGKAERLLCLVQPLTPPPEAVGTAEESVGEAKKEEDDDLQRQQYVYVTPRYGLSVYNATFDTWHRVRLPSPMPLFCECVTLQATGKLVLIGGWDPETLQPVKDVFVLDFSGEGGGGRRWRRGSPMPVARSFFACAAVGSTKVYVAGGHDDQKNALRSAEVYDVEKDKWEALPPMEEGRDECYGVAMAEDQGFCVLSGYGTENQGGFRSDAEVYDPVSNSWSRIENVWPFSDTSPRGRTAAVAGGGGDKREWRLWCFTRSNEGQSQERREMEDKLKKWKVVVEIVQLPVTGTSFYAGSLGGGQAVVMGGRGESEEDSGMVMTRMEENRNVKWGHTHMPLGFSSLPFSHASISL